MPISLRSPLFFSSLVIDYLPRKFFRFVKLDKILLSKTFLIIVFFSILIRKALNVYYCDTGAKTGQPQIPHTHQFTPPSPPPPSPPPPPPPIEYIHPTLRLSPPPPPPPPPPPAPAPAPAPAPPPHPVEYVLSLQWGYTVCGQYPICSWIRLVPDLTIHGLWMVNQPKNLTVCTGEKFDIGSLTSISYLLNSYWMDAQYGNNQVFWRRQYEKHGICDNGTVPDYFQKAVDAYVMSNGGWKLGTTIRTMFYWKPTMLGGVIQSGLSVILKKRFALVCKYDYTTGYYDLQELRLQFKEVANQFVLVDLVNIPYSVLCPYTGYIALPLQ